MASLGQGGVEMYAIIETGGKQFKVQEGDVLNVERLQAAEGETVEITKVLANTSPRKTTAEHKGIVNLLRKLLWKR